MDPVGIGGQGGGGNGQTNASGPAATAGIDGLGGGGGGLVGTSASGGLVGGSGVVILRVLGTDYTGTTTGSPTVTTSGTNTIIKFTGSGTLTT